MSNFLITPILLSLAFAPPVFVETLTTPTNPVTNENSISSHDKPDYRLAGYYGRDGIWRWDGDIPDPCYHWNGYQC